MKKIILKPRPKVPRMRIKISKIDISKDLERMVRANKRLLIELSK